MMTTADIGLWVGIICGVIGTIASTIAAIYTVLARHWPKSSDGKPRAQGVSGRLIGGMICLVLLSWGGVAFDLYERHAGNGPLIYAWGSADKGVFYITAAGNTMSQYKTLFKAMLINRVPYANVDRMTDTYIEKSQMYSITDDPITLANVGGPHLRVMLDQPLTLEYNLVVVRSMFSPDQIKSLADVEALGGKILANPMSNITFTRLPPAIPSPPSDACPAAPR